MKVSIYGVIFYGFLVLIGGFIGYVKADSLPSLIMGTVFGVLLFGAAIAMFKGKAIGRWMAVGLSVLLVAFFGYRLFITHSLMPAALIILVGLWLIIRLSIRDFRQN
jgi:uncharacterized membrane protein (UPF0136 family)